MNSYIFYVDILRRGKYNEGKYCAEYGNRLNTPERRCVSTGGSTVSVAEPFCPTTSRNWEEATSLIGVKQHQKVVLVWREGVGCIAAQVPKVVSGEERGI